MFSANDPFRSPVKTNSQKQYDQELLSPDMNENFTFLLGTDYSVRVETLTPGPVHSPRDSQYRKTPGIDRPTPMLSLGAFEHSANLEKKNELLQKCYLIEESPHSDYEFLCDELQLSRPIPALQQPFQYSHEQNRDDCPSPGKNPYSQPFVPQNHHSSRNSQPFVPQNHHSSRNTLDGSSGEPRFFERVPPLPRGSQYPARISPDSNPQSYPLQSLIESRNYSAPISRISERTRVPGRSQGPMTSEYNNHPPYQNQARSFVHHGSYLSEYQKNSVNKGKTNPAYPPEVHLPTTNAETQKHNKDSSLPRPSSPKPSRSDLVESPVSKSLYKNFLKSFKTKEGESFSEAITYAVKELENVPEKVRWRAYIDVADTLKRNSHYGDARYYYRKVCEEYPHLNQGWLEWSKMEEECGNLEQSLLVLRKGARTNHSYNEVLLTKAIKQHERLNNLTGAREMLGKLQEEGIDTTWRTVLEGSLLESRAGNIAMARKLLSALMSRVSWYGPIYHEAFRLEEKAENFDNALAVVQRGLHELPRYGPLWFGLLRIMERKDMLDEANEWTTGESLPLLKRTRSESQNAICSISRELVWKVHFEQAQIEERAMEIVALGRHLSTGKSLLACRDELSSAARKCYTQSLMTCPANLRWKVYLAGSRLEMAADQIDTAHLLLRQAKLEVPDKSKYHVFLECSRLEEFLGNIDAARKILWIARREIKNEWKLYLEAVLVEARAGNLVGAIYLADKALSMDSGSGRLWALLVQLVHRCEWRNKLLLGQEMTKQKQKDEIEDRLDCAEITPPSDYKIPSKYTILCRALCVVPKSGEVWCEGARTLLNPLSMKYFDLGKAQKYLSFSIQFTPQYGDSFIEYIRLEMLTQILLPRVLFLLGVPVNFFFSLLDNFDLESDSSKSLKNIREMVEVAFSGSYHLLRSNPKDNVALAKKGLLDIGHCREALEKISIANLTRRCINADPNYGTAWFYCRCRPFDTPSAVIRSAFSTIVHELISAQSVYVNAIVGYVIRVVSHHLKSKSDDENPEAVGDVQSFDLESWLAMFVESASDVNSEELKDDDEDDLVAPFYVEQSSSQVFSSQDFITALIKLNRVMYTRENSLEEKRKILFGVDQISP